MWQSTRARNERQQLRTVIIVELIVDQLPEPDNLLRVALIILQHRMLLPVFDVDFL